MDFKLRRLLGIIKVSLIYSHKLLKLFNFSQLWSEKFDDKEAREQGQENKEPADIASFDDKMAYKLINAGEL